MSRFHFSKAFSMQQQHPRVQGISAAYVPTAEDIENDRKLEAWKAKRRADDIRALRDRADAEHRARVADCVRMYAARQAGSIWDVVALERAAGDEAHVTGLPLVRCQQYVRRNAALVEQLCKD